MTIQHLIVSCTSPAQAAKIGTALLKQRLIGCFDVVAKTSAYYWPPKKGKITKSKGALLTAATLPRHVAAAKKLIAAKHSDRVPFIGVQEVHHVDHAYYLWLAHELKSHG